MRSEEPFGVQGPHEHIWHIAAAERWADGLLIGHRTYCGRNYGPADDRPEIASLSQVCSDCTAQRTECH